METGMATIQNEKRAEEAFQQAATLVDDLHDGVIPERRERAVQEEAAGLLNDVIDYHRSAGNTHRVAAALDQLGILTRHSLYDDQKASAYFLEAASLFEPAGDRLARLAPLMELGEIDPANALAGQAAEEAIRAGLPDDLHYSQDPMRLAIAKRHSRDVDGGMALYNAMLEEALNRDAKTRAATLLCEIARCLEDDRKDRKGATEALERGLALAENAGDKTETGAALLRLTDIWWSRNNPAKSREYFARVLKMRGLPAWQKKADRADADVFSRSLTQGCIAGTMMLSAGRPFAASGAGLERLPVKGYNNPCYEWRDFRSRSQCKCNGSEIDLAIAANTAHKRASQPIAVAPVASLRNAR
jgi:tetratricopeptide (TPR) repeat protein